MKSIALSAAAVVAMSSLVFAGGDIVPVVPIVVENVEESNFYLGVGISAVSTRDSTVSMDIFNVKDGQDRLGNATFHAGYEMNDYLAFEGRYTTTFQDEDKVTQKGWSIFLKPIYKFEDEEERANGENYFAVYALLGYGGVKIDGANNFPASVDENGFQWGVGLSYTFRDHSNEDNYKYKDTWTVFADYTNIGNDMDGYYYNGARQIDTDAFTVGLNYKF